MMPKHLNLRGVAAMVENWFSIQAERPSSVHHQYTVATTGSGVKG
ncbi:hypothetical protein MGWOODY_Clf1501 [hydrothermal vent metagenome]|uniref:Uncharacterized protein n=1 Tax=hydrothermal vent metagenome TaxID=652676 RepID=A0A160V7C5_9ZZZZ